MQFALQVTNGPDTADLFTAMLDEESESCFDCKTRDGRDIKIRLNIRSLTRIMCLDGIPRLLIQGRDSQDSWPKYFVLYAYEDRVGYAFPYEENQGMIGLPPGAEEVIREIVDLIWDINGMGDNEVKALSLFRYYLYGVLIYMNCAEGAAKDYQYWVSSADR